MTPDRQRVRVTESFFDQLDQLLPPDRSPTGQPSVTDFLVIDLPAVVDRFATGFDDLPEILEGLPRPGCSSPPADSPAGSSSSASRHPTASSTSLGIDLDL